MMLALTAEEEVKCPGELADASALSVSKDGVEGGTPLVGKEGSRKGDVGRGECERWPTPPPWCT